MSYSTTTKVPAPGCHVYVRSDGPNSDCTLCGEAPWRAIHNWTFESAPIAPQDCLFRMEASDDHGANWASNGLRWATPAEASEWARDLSLRWFGCTNIRIVRESDGQVVEVIL